MYNRYIPQPDGSYRRSRIQEQRPAAPARRPEPSRPEPVSPPCEPEKKWETTPRENPGNQRKKTTAGSPERGLDGFLKKLLPGDFDTGDLLVILLLLLMAGDSEEGRSNALLTIAMYFLM